MRAGISLILFLLVFNAFSQKKKYREMHYENVNVITDKADFNIAGTFSYSDQIKTKIKVTNKTDKVIIVKLAETYFQYGEHKGQDITEWLIVPPMRTEGKVIKTESDKFHEDSVGLVIGGIYLCGPAIKPEKVILNVPPPSSFSIGNFHLKLDKSKIDNENANFNYLVNYTGNKLAFFDPKNAKMSSRSGFNNENKKGGNNAYFIAKDTTFEARFGFHLDPQNSNSLTMDGAFFETDSEMLKPFSIVLHYDEEASRKERNSQVLKVLTIAGSAR